MQTLKIAYSLRLKGPANLKAAFEKNLSDRVGEADSLSASADDVAPDWLQEVAEDLFQRQEKGEAPSAEEYENEFALAAARRAYYDGVDEIYEGASDEARIAFRITLPFRAFVSNEFSRAPFQGKDDVKYREQMNEVIQAAVAPPRSIVVEYYTSAQSDGSVVGWVENTTHERLGFFADTSGLSALSLIPNPFAKKAEDLEENKENSVPHELFSFMFPLNSVPRVIDRAELRRVLEVADSIEVASLGYRPEKDWEFEPSSFREVWERLELAKIAANARVVKP